MFLHWSFEVGFGYGVDIYVLIEVGVGMEMWRENTWAWDGIVQCAASMCENAFHIQVAQPPTRFWLLAALLSISFFPHAINVSAFVDISSPNRAALFF